MAYPCLITWVLWFLQLLPLWLRDRTMVITELEFCIKITFFFSLSYKIKYSCFLKIWAWIKKNQQPKIHIKIVILVAGNFFPFLNSLIIVIFFKKYRGQFIFSINSSPSTRPYTPMSISTHPYQRPSPRQRPRSHSHTHPYPRPDPINPWRSGLE